MPKGIYKRINTLKGKKRSKKVKDKISSGLKNSYKNGKRKSWNKNKRYPQISGENHWNWQGGKTNIRILMENQIKYRQWRSDVFTRDNFTCQKCHSKGKKGKRIILNVHHIKYVSIIIQEYNIKSIDDILNCEELWNINNGITLCKDCHKKYHKNDCFIR